MFRFNFVYFLFECVLLLDFWFNVFFFFLFFIAFFLTSSWALMFLLTLLLLFSCWFFLPSLLLFYVTLYFFFLSLSRYFLPSHPYMHISGSFYEHYHHSTKFSVVLWSIEDKYRPARSSEQIFDCIFSVRQLAFFNVFRCFDGSAFVSVWCCCCCCCYGELLSRSKRFSHLFSIQCMCVQWFSRKCRAVSRHEEVWLSRIRSTFDCVSVDL